MDRSTHTIVPGTHTSSDDRSTITKVRMPEDERTYYTVKEAAYVMGVSQETIRKLAAAKEFDATQPFGRRGGYRIEGVELTGFMRKRLLLKDDERIQTPTELEATVKKIPDRPRKQQTKPISRNDH